MIDVWLSSKRMTVMVTINDKNIIKKTAPIVRKFINQHLQNLERWMKKQGNFRKKIL